MTFKCGSSALIRNIALPETHRANPSYLALVEYLVFAVSSPKGMGD